jgi:hypothetical protein
LIIFFRSLKSTNQNKILKMSKEEEFEDGFISNKTAKFNNITNCSDLEDELQLCILKNKGLYGCGKINEKYSICLEKEISKIYF